MELPIDAWRPPLLWRVLLVAARVAAGAVCRLRVTGNVAPTLRRGPVILAVNHVGVFDPVALAAACRSIGVAPRLMATAGLFRAPVVGSVLRASGHIRVDRQEATAGNALDAAAQALAERSVVAAYPEGRITLDPGLWPERGKTGVARLALRTGVPVIPVAQWGAHEVMAWHGWGAMALTLLRSVLRRPVVRVHFAAPLDLSGFDPDTPGAAQRVTERVMLALTEELAPLRRDEPGLPRYVDPTRPVSTARRLRHTEGRTGTPPAAGRDG
ncbi:MAG TPA: lysophospholipid acyltransferase family protein [Micromonosporaceae bacterium]|nr:lysophospholipid acyltransferase family protein [Micromonosporaceae bacterium]